MCFLKLCATPEIITLGKFQHTSFQNVERSSSSNDPLRVTTNNGKYENTKNKTMVTPKMPQNVFTIFIKIEEFHFVILHNKS